MRLTAISDPLIGLAFCVLSSILSSEFCRHFVTKNRLYAAPLFSLHALIPMCLNDKTEAAVCCVLSSTLVTWWGTARVIALLSGHGPLASANTQRSLGLFWMSYFLPINLKRGSNQELVQLGGTERYQKGFTLVGRFMYKLLGLLLLLYSLDKCETLEHLSHACSKGTLIGDVCWSFVVLLTASGLMDFPAGLVCLLGMDVEEHFASPLLSSSLRDFWGHRWNMTAARLLRHGCFNPLKKLNLSNSVAAVFTFAVSGVFHEAILWYGSRSKQGCLRGYWLLFFLLQALAAKVELIVEKRFRLHNSWLIRLWAVIFLLTSTRMFFLPPAYR
uniref:Wax synthase domain-containing protein n=1 Tax=Guillardia theta TaxID=55529 RepID=A0A6U6CBI6_GUITH|mmetsp:Transcript_46264/g.145113  ORF Transcript_46264/g.145113 Transcript_46264/m.145113 type:complete len:330 (+) Transcript_46264:74-1063(+)